MNEASWGKEVGIRLNVWDDKKTFLNFAPSYVANYFYLLMIKYSIKAGKTLRNLFSESMSTMCIVHGSSCNYLFVGLGITSKLVRFSQSYIQVRFGTEWNRVLYIFVSSNQNLSDSLISNTKNIVKTMRGPNFIIFIIKTNAVFQNLI